MQNVKMIEPEFFTIQSHLYSLHKKQVMWPAFFFFKKKNILARTIFYIFITRMP